MFHQCTAQPTALEPFGNSKKSQRPAIFVSILAKRLCSQFLYPREKLQDELAPFNTRIQTYYTSYPILMLTILLPGKLLILFMISPFTFDRGLCFYSWRIDESDRLVPVDCVYFTTDGSI